MSLLHIEELSSWIKQHSRCSVSVFVSVQTRTGHSVIFVLYCHSLSIINIVYFESWLFPASFNIVHNNVWCVVSFRILFYLPDPGQSVATGIEMEDCACHICGKVLRRTGLRRHIVDRHYPSQQAPCKLCGKVFKTANSLSTHMNAFHKHFRKLPATSSHTWMPLIDSFMEILINLSSICGDHMQYALLTENCHRFYSGNEVIVPNYRLPFGCSKVKGMW